MSSGSFRNNSTYELFVYIYIYYIYIYIYIYIAGHLAKIIKTPSKHYIQVFPVTRVSHWWSLIYAGLTTRTTVLYKARSKQYLAFFRGLSYFVILPYLVQADKTIWHPLSVWRIGWEFSELVRFHVISTFVGPFLCK